MSRSRVTISVLIVLSVTLLPVQAHAGRWDPRDDKGLYDLRWAGATVRIDALGRWPHGTVSFWRNVTTRDLPDHWRTVVEMAELKSITASHFIYFLPGPHGRIRGLFGESGSFCCSTVRVVPRSARSFRFSVIPIPRGTVDGFDAFFVESGTWHGKGKGVSDVFGARLTVVHDRIGTRRHPVPLGS